MANEEKKDFNAMLHKDTGMPKIQMVTDQEIWRREDVFCAACYLR